MRYLEKVTKTLKLNMKKENLNQFDNPKHVTVVDQLQRAVNTLEWSVFIMTEDRAIKAGSHWFSLADHLQTTLWIPE